MSSSHATPAKRSVSAPAPSSTFASPGTVRGRSGGCISGAFRCFRADFRHAKCRRSLWCALASSTFSSTGRRFESAARTVRAGIKPASDRCAGRDRLRRRRPRARLRARGALARRSDAQYMKRRRVFTQAQRMLGNSRIDLIGQAPERRCRRSVRTEARPYPTCHKWCGGSCCRDHK